MSWESYHLNLAESDLSYPDEERHILHCRTKKSENRWNKDLAELVQDCEAQEIEPYVD
jgi:hypothetical protein